MILVQLIDPKEDTFVPFDTMKEADQVFRNRLSKSIDLATDSSDFRFLHSLFPRNVFVTQTIDEVFSVRSQSELVQIDRPTPREMPRSEVRDPQSKCTDRTLHTRFLAQFQAQK
jgi:hypothetical protein